MEATVSMVLFIHRPAALAEHVLNFQGDLFDLRTTVAQLAIDGAVSLFYHVFVANLH